MDQKKYIRLIPFVILFIMLFYTWINIFRTDYFATIRHQLALGFFLLNLALYFIRFDWAVGLTGVILALATFNAIALLPIITYSSYHIEIAGVKISTPSIQLSSLAVLMVYIVIDRKQVRAVWRFILK